MFSEKIFKKYITTEKLLPNTWIVIRIDGKGFHKFTKLHDFIKPNDDRGLDLMNYAAEETMRKYDDLIII